MSLIENKRLRPTLERLAEKHRTVLALLVYGEDGSGKPLTVIEVADKLKVRRAYVRNLLREPAFKLEYAEAIQAARAAYVPGAVHKVGSLIDSEDEQIALKASQVIMGETAKAPAIQVNVGVQTNVQANVRAGYRFEPCDRPAAAKIIDGTAD